ncbi:hypothetical protein BpHYR1_019970 [Brachionus plicatilis]|uniref:Uncharacterized protein n=1 Tax=Brachionus plicatilis TaxID=10195 RepID=A0A3M7PQ39_BRAPC|nr:hypothetical protein BpHYR1_019970 [Brachionus plicatilis]
MAVDPKSSFSVKPASPAIMAVSMASNMVMPYEFRLPMVINQIWLRLLTEGGINFCTKFSHCCQKSKPDLTLNFEIFLNKNSLNFSAKFLYVCKTVTTSMATEARKTSNYVNNQEKSYRNGDEKAKI